MQQIVARIDAQLSEIRAEVERLEKARAALAPGPQQRATTRRTNGRSRTRTRRSVEDSKNAILGIVGNRPGISRSDFAREMKVSPGRISQLIKEMTADGAVKTEDGGILLTPSSGNGSQAKSAA